jgi:predicted dehydrogenase
MKKIAIGILGTADIAPRSIVEPVKDIKDAFIYGVASRDINRAKKFAHTYNIPNIFSSYDALLKCDDIDMVYIPLINSLHADWIIKTAEVKKHILVEKPVCMHSMDFEEIEKAVMNNGIYILEGLMVQHHPWQQKIKEIIQSGIYGRIKSIKTHACYMLDDNDSFRLDPVKGGGVFFEEGILWCQLTQLCLGLDPISTTSKSFFREPDGADVTFKARMNFSNDVYSELLCSYERPYEANHWFQFEKAHLKIRNFWRPTFGFFKIKFEINNLQTNQNEKIIFSPQNYYNDQLIFFIQVLKGDKKNISLKSSFERIAMMEKLFNNSEKNYVSK